MVTTPEQMEQLYSDFSPIKKSELVIRQSELLNKVISQTMESQQRINLLEKSLNHEKMLLRQSYFRCRYLEKRLNPPTIKNPLNLEPGNFFAASNDYGSCKVSITGITRKYSCGLWHELYEYTAECKSHNGLDTHVTFGQASSVSDITARYFLSNFSMEF